MALRESPLHDAHTGVASFTEFGGWEMPVEFDSIREEHTAVRTSVGKFDISHMGEIRVTGPDAGALTQRLTTNDVAGLDPGDAQYSAITDDDGILLDDTLVYRIPGGWDGAGGYLFVPNAGHDAEMADRWRTHRDEWGLDATVENITDEYAMVALQGPDAVETLTATIDGSIAELSRFAMAAIEVAGVDCLVSRTGYTGEDGYELLIPADSGTQVWSAFDCQPCGLGARDTLRLEAGFLLSGQDFDPVDERRTPYEAGIGFVVKLDTEFVGRDALERVQAEGVGEKLVGIRLVERGVPRHGYEITDAEGNGIGHVTSGTMSPTLDYSIGMGYLPTDYTEPDTRVRVVVRGQGKKARIQSLPFYEQT